MNRQIELITCTDGEILREKMRFSEEIREKETRVVNLYPGVTGQTVCGFGGAVTDAAGYVYSLMPEKLQKQLMDLYFGENGLSYRVLRVPIDSCDFSVEMFESMSEPDETFGSFSMERELKYILPMLKDAKAAAHGDISLMLSPWSPPAKWKDNGERKHGGKLLPQYRALWAEYIVRYVKEFEALGFPVAFLTVQNEPKAVQTWDSCVYTAEEEKRFIDDFLKPALTRAGLDHIRLIGWDHNKERAYEWARVLGSSVDGIGCHWYSGDHFEALDLIGKEFPSHELMLTESCIEFSHYSKEDSLVNALRLAHELMGDLNHGMSRFIDWNMLLDADGGPNHVGNFCDAPFLYDMPQNQLDIRPIFDIYRQFALAIPAGSRRIASSSYTSDIECAAFIRPDAVISAVLMNRSSEEKTVRLRLNDEICEFKFPPRSVRTAIIK